LDHAQGLGRGVFGGEKQQIDIAEWRQHSASIAAGGRDAQIFDGAKFSMGGCMLEKGRDNPIDQRAQKSGGLQSGDLFMFEGMLNIGLNTRQMAPESTH